MKPQCFLNHSLYNVCLYYDQQMKLQVCKRYLLIKDPITLKWSNLIHQVFVFESYQQLHSALSTLSFKLFAPLLFIAWIDNSWNWNFHKTSTLKMEWELNRRYFHTWSNPFFKNVRVGQYEARYLSLCKTFYKTISHDKSQGINLDCCVSNVCWDLSLIMMFNSCHGQHRQCSTLERF